MKQFPTDWKKSYWPEPRLGGSKLTRGQAIRNNREAIKERARARYDKAISAAVNED